MLLYTDFSCLQRYVQYQENSGRTNREVAYATKHTFSKVRSQNTFGSSVQSHKVMHPLIFSKKIQGNKDACQHEGFNFVKYAKIALIDEIY